MLALALLAPQCPPANRVQKMQNSTQQYSKGSATILLGTPGVNKRTRLKTEKKGKIPNAMLYVYRKCKM